MKTRLTVLLLLTLTAGWLRFTATSFGLPDKFRPDEEYMLSPSLGFNDSWNPHFSTYPAAQMYVQHAVFRLGAVLMRTPGDFRTVYLADNQALAYLFARRSSAAFGTATVPAMYFAVAPIFGPAAALYAAAIVAFSTIHVLDSKFATTDVPAAFWLTLALAMVLRMAREGRTRHYVGASLFSGLATATKYPAGAIVAAVGAAHLGAARHAGRSVLRSFGDPRIYLAGFLTFITFFCATPYVLLDPAQTMRDYSYQRNFVTDGFSAAGYGWPWLLLRAMPDCLGIALQAVVLIALVWALFCRKPGTLSVLAFIAVTFLALTTSRQLFYRYILVPFPAMALLAGGFLADLSEFSCGRSRGRVRVFVLLFGLLLAPSLVRDLQLNRLLLRTDTRTLARQWITSQIPAGSTIAEIDDTTRYGKPQLPGSYQIVPFADPSSLRASNVQWVLSDSAAPLWLYSRGPSEAELASLKAGATLVFDADPMIPGSAKPVFDINDAFYAPLKRASSMKRPGPRIRIWKLK